MDSAVKFVLWGFSPFYMYLVFVIYGLQLDSRFGTQDS